MSLPKSGKVLPRSKDGDSMNMAGTITNQAVAERIGGALRSALYGWSCPSKRVSRITGQNPRTIRNLMDGANAPSAATLIKLMREFDEVHNEVLRLADRIPTETSVSPEKIEQLLKILCGDTNAEINPDRISQLAGSKTDHKV